jgi:hypothetical protein
MNKSIIFNFSIVYYHSRLRCIFEKHLTLLTQDLETVLRHDDQQDTNHQKIGTGHKNLNEKFEKEVDQVLYCLQPSIRRYITVFNLNSEDDLSETIFRGICKCKLIHYKIFQPISTCFL